MKRRQTLIGCAVAAALAVPFTAGAQNTTLHQYPQASGNTSQVAPEDARFPGPARDEKQAQQDHPDLMVITIESVAPPMTYRQRAESTFRALDRDSDGEISMAEAGVNTQLVSAFRKLDRDSNRALDRQEFAQVHVNDGRSASQQASSERQSVSAAGGGTVRESTTR